MKITSQAQLEKAVETKLGFIVIETRNFPTYRNVTPTPSWDIELMRNGTSHVVEGNTVQELYDNIIEELL